MDVARTYSIHTLCRICLNLLQNDAAYDLYMVPGLAKKLCLCTSLSVEQNDGFPKNLCTNCYTRLNDMHDFQKLCVDSVQKFQDMVASNAFTCQSNFDVLDPSTATHDLPNEDEDHINFDPLLNHKMELIENEEDVFKMLEDCDKEAEEVEKEVKQDKKMKEIKEPITINMFNEDSSSIESGNDNDRDIDFEPNSSDDDIPLAQRMRSKTTATKSTRAAKSQAKPKKKTKPEDDDEFSTSSSSDDDDDDDDDDEEGGGKRDKPKRKRIPAAERHLHRIIDCHICHQKFKKAIRYEEHMKYHNDLLPFQCKVESCKKGFTTANGLRIHVDHAHTELSEVHACSVEGCGKTFPRVRLLTFHMKKVHNISKSAAPLRDFPCTECDTVFRCPTALKKHMYKHTGEELPYPCNICGKRFVINSALRDHLMRHAGIKNHVCPYCGVGKTTRQEWNAHILTHTKEKKFKCRQCDHASHNKQALSNHVKVVHMKIKNFACQYCGKTFGKSHACKVHERTHTGEKCCECKICGKIFLCEKSLTKHLKTHEKRDLPPVDMHRPLNIPLPGAHQMPEHMQGDGMMGGQHVADDLLKACGGGPAPGMPGVGVGIGVGPGIPAKPKNSRRVQRVDISQLAGTSVNPIPSVSVPSWSPQVNFTKKEGQHICPGCGRGFNNIGNMKLHYKIIHEKVKDFACRFCPKRFSKAQILRHHEWIHTGEKPFECKICGKHFRQETALKKHIKTHDKPNRRNYIPEKVTEAPTTFHKIEPREIDREPRNYEQYQDPAAERAAATAELLAHQIEENEAKRKADIERRKIQEAACEQLNKLQKQQEIEKATTSYDGYYAQKAQAEGISVDALKIDHV
ncbi:zinc finger protein 236 [Drosophila nasuta]|uniref:Zinc finger protein 236 n=1 Tax=Drosophila albomicans TaxID=7291 RepID=A0A6P8X546_DROAB|nr:zinc finger protein 236 [Drosophila albomicans]XP_060659869.1 zinc finger protein 236 [Drosophila nasuta]